MEFNENDFCITTEKNKLDVNAIHQYLSRESYWAKNIPLEVVEKSIKNSLCFGVFYKEKQIGFARLVTDYATFAYLCDVYMLDEFRGIGLSKWLMKTIIHYPGLQGLRRWMLATADAHSLYEKFGFTPISKPERFMHLHQPDVYREQ